MLIAVDATAVRSRHHGVGTYVINLLESLVTVESEYQYLVYMSRPALAGTGLDRTAPSRVTTVPVTRFRPLRLIWEKHFMNQDARRRGADLLWGCHNSLPSHKNNPSVVTVHDLGVFALPEYYPGSKVAWFRRSIARAVETADIVVAVSRFTAEELERWLNVPADRIRVVHNGVSAHFRKAVEADTVQRVKARYNLPGRYVLTVGVPEPKKNLLRVLAAWQLLIERGKNPPVLVIGGGRSYGWQNREVYRAIAKLGNRVLATDFIDFADLPTVYSLADLFVFPSLYEGFGLPPLEAMACGTPVISSNVASMPEVVGDAGLLVNPTSVEAIAGNVEKLIADPALRAELGRRGPERAKLFSWDASARKLADEFGRIANRAG